MAKEDFMIVNPQSGKASINKNEFIKYLSSLGYRCYSDGGTPTLINIKNNLIYQDDKDVLYKKIADIFSESEAHLALFIDRPNAYIGSDKICFLPSFEPKLLRDNKKTSYIPFINGIVKITADEISVNPFKNILSTKRLLYKDDIKDFKIQITTDYLDGDFARFVSNAVTAEGFDYAMRAIGYLLHKYKDPSMAKIVAFSDANDTTSRYANGGTGKSLIAKDALAYIRNTKCIDGKQFMKDDKFRFQGVTPRHDVVAVEDIMRGADLSLFFNACTGYFQVQDRFKDSVNIPFEDSPKILMTSNQALQIRGTSEQRRICPIGFSDHYNVKTTPLQEFGKLFFSSEWSEKDWLDFYNFMFSCIQRYLKDGLDSYGYTALQHKALIQKYGLELYNAVKTNQEQIAIFHTRAGIVDAFEDAFNPYPEDVKSRYEAVEDIMSEFDWKMEARKMVCYNNWALPDDEARSHKNGMTTPVKRLGYIYTKLK